MLDKPGTSSALAAATRVPLPLSVRVPRHARDRSAWKARCRSDATRHNARLYGLYAEQLSGTAFTAPRATNRAHLVSIASGLRRLHGSGFSRRRARVPAHRRRAAMKAISPIGQLRWKSGSRFRTNRSIS